MTLKIDDIRDHIQRNVEAALAEDIGSGDITAQLIPADKVDTAEIITREQCVMCGQAWADETFAQLDPSVELTWHVKDGDILEPNQKLVTLHGNTRSLLTGERTALNFLQLLCGTATKAKEYADALGDSHIKILDTRKTIPGLRMAQKYAVGVGGCHNHRLGLYDAFLIKENHIAACGSIAKAIAIAKNCHPSKPVEIEVENFKQLKTAINANADSIMLDNFSSSELSLIKNINVRQSKLEFSGNLSYKNIKEAIDLPIDYLSFGDLTKNLQSIDLSMRLKMIT